MSKSTNVLLTHGAWADGSCWAKVIPLLQAKGLNVLAAQIPLTSLEDDIAVTRRMLRRLSGPTVLVGHSYGGAVITGAGEGSENVSALVYITGFGLDEGESLDALSKQGPPSAGSAAIGPDFDGFLWIDRERFHSAFVADGTATEAAVIGRGPETTRYRRLYRSVRNAGVEIAAVLVPAMHGRSHDSAARAAFHGRTDGREGPHCCFEPCAVHGSSGRCRRDHRARLLSESPDHKG